MSRLTKIILAVVILLAVLAAVGVLYIRSAAFTAYVKAQVISAAGRATGGRVEIGRFQWSLGGLSSIHATVNDLVIHGTEPAGQPPLLSAGTLEVRANIISVMRRELDWQLLRVDRPSAHVTVDPNGRSNVPRPVAPPPPTPRPVEQQEEGPINTILKLAVDRVEVTNGEALYNDQKTDFNFSMDKVEAALKYEQHPERYTGSLSFQAPLPTALTGPTKVPSQVQADVVILPGLVKLPRIVWKTPNSTLESNAEIRFSAPKMTMNYTLSLDPRDLAGVLKPMQVAGRVTARGQLSFDTGTSALISSGAAELHRIDLRSPGEFRVSNISGATQYKVAGDTLNLTSFTLSLLGGRLTGSAVVNDYRTSPKTSVTAKAHSLSIYSLAQAFSTGRRPLDLPWVGSVSGDTKVAYNSGRRADIRLEAALLVTPPSVTPPGKMPVRGRVNANYNSAADRLDLRDTVIDTPASHLAADGLLAAGRGRNTNLRVSFTTSNLDEWSPVIASLTGGKAGPLPVKVSGPASFQGMVRGSFSQPILDGHAEASDFIFRGSHWDRLAADVFYSPSELRLAQAQLVTNGSTARFSLTAGLRDSTFSDNSPFTLRAQVANAPLEKIQPLAGVSVPLTGTLNASADLSGTRSNPNGKGVVRVTNGTIAGESFNSFQTDLGFGPNRIDATNIILRKDQARIVGQAHYNPDTRGIQFQLAGDQILIESFDRVRALNAGLSGRASFEANGGGTLDRPVINGALRVADLAVRGERRGSLTAQVETRERTLTADLSSRFLRGSLTGRLTADMTGLFPAQGRVQFTAVDLDPLLAPLLKAEITTHSTVTGSLTLSGPLKKPEALAVNLLVDNFHVAVEQIDLRNQGPLRVAYNNGTVTVQEAHLTGLDTDVRISGNARVTGPPATRTLNVHADGRINLALLRSLQPNLETKGQIVVQAHLGGTIRRPQLTGEALLQNASVALPDFPVGLSEMQGRLVFDTSRLRIEKVTAQAGGGNMLLIGFIDYLSQPAVFRLRVEADKVRLRYPEGTSSVLDGAMDLTGTTRRSLLAGDVTVTRLRFEPRFDLARTLGVVRTPAATPVTNPILNSMQLDVRVKSSPDIRFEFAQAKNVQLDADLRLRGTAARPVLLGRVSLLQGEINFAGTTYSVNRGDITFANPFRIEPVLNLDLQTTVQQYEIAISLNGPMEKLSVNYRSEPPLPSNEIQALLITGRTPTDRATAPAQSLTQIGANTILSQALNSAVSSRIERIFGVTRLRINPQVGGPESNPSARVTLEQQVTSDVRFTYITNLSSAQQQIIQVEWVVNQHWSVVAVRDQDGLFGIDFKWRKRFK